MRWMEKAKHKLPLHIGVLLRLAHFFTIIGLVSALLFLFNMGGGTLFLFSVPGTGLIILSMVIFIIVLIYDYLQRHSLFQVETFDAGEIIFHQGGEGDKVYMIQSGEVEIFREENQSKMVLAKLKAGEYFGEMALLSEGKRNASVAAITPVELVAIGKENFDALIINLPSVRKDFKTTFEKRKSNN